MKMEENKTLGIHDCNAYFTQYLSFNTIVISLLLIFGIVGNGEVLFLYGFKMRQTEERFFIPHLAVADLVSSICLAGLSITMNYYYADFPNEILCKLLHYFSWVTSSWSAFLLLMISISRYLKICRPTGKQMTLFGKKWAVYGCLLFAIINTSPVIYFVGNRHQNVSCLNTNVTVAMCELRDFDGILHTLKMTYIFIEICVVFSNAGITAGLYIPIGLQIYRRFLKRSRRKRQIHGLYVLKGRYSVDKNGRENVETTVCSEECTKKGLNFECESQLDSVVNTIQDNVRQNQQEVAIESEMSCVATNDIKMQYVDNSDIQQSKIRQTGKVSSYYVKRRHGTRFKVRNNFTYMFITIIIFYLLSYLPTFVTMLLATDDPFHYWHQMDIVTLNFIMLLRRSSIINHIVNPFIYGYFDRVFRQRFLECFVCKKC